MKRLNKGQSTLEYVILAGFVVAALIAMGVYMKRGFQGRLRESTDQVGQQYDPLKVSSEYTVVTNADQYEKLETTGKLSTTLTGTVGKNTQTKQAAGHETVAAP